MTRLLSLLACLLLCGGCASLPLWAWEQVGVSEQAAHEAAVAEVYAEDGP